MRNLIRRLKMDGSLHMIYGMTFGIIVMGLIFGGFGVFQVLHYEQLPTGKEASYSEETYVQCEDDAIQCECNEEACPCCKRTIQLTVPLGERIADVFWGRFFAGAGVGFGVGAIAGYAIWERRKYT
jgi:hypothetical protein